MDDAFVSVLAATVKNDDSSKPIIHVRRSLRHLNNTPKIVGPMVIPLEPIMEKAVQSVASSGCDEFSADSLEENSPDNRGHKLTGTAKRLNGIDVHGDLVQPLRRSTRKTPSKYRSTDVIILDRVRNISFIHFLIFMLCGYVFIIFFGHNKFDRYVRNE